MPVHVNQFSAEGKYPNGRPSRAADCTVACGMMALDDFTLGAIRPSATEFRRRQNDQVGGIGLNDVAVVWKTYGLKFTHGPKSWGTVMNRLRAGKPAILQGISGALGPYAVGKSVPHAIYATRAGPEGLRIHDPLRQGPVTIPETYVRRFYVTGLALAGWGEGTYAGGGPSTTPAPPPDAVAPGPVVVGTVTKILARPGTTCTVAPVPLPTGVGPFNLVPWDGKVFPIPAGRVTDPCACPAGYNRAWYDPRLEDVTGTSYVPLNRLPANGANACVRSDQREGSVFGNQLQDTASVPFAMLAGAIGEASYVLIIGGAIAALFLLGAWRLTSK